jgi:uncharacterized protein YbjT (DUF2867 family)
MSHDVVIAGGHGQIALLLERRLAAAGHRARGLVRDREQGADLQAAGAEPVVADLEALDDLTPFVTGASAVVFAAGAGPGSGAARKRTVDLGGAVKLADAARAAGVGRYLMVSAMGAGDPAAGSEAMRPYLDAKAQADEAVAASGLDFTIIRPGGLTDEPATGQVAVGARLPRGSVPRDDVAAVLVACLDEPGTVGRTFDLVSGDTPIEQALRSL